MTDRRTRRRLPVVLYRVLEVSVMVITYVVLAFILYRAIVWIF